MTVENSGDRNGSLVRLMNAYEKDVFRICLALLKDVSMAEDAVQETFLKVYRKFDTFRGECSEKNWILKIAIHTCKDLQRSKWFRHIDRRITLETIPEPLMPLVQEDSDLINAIFSLPAKERQIIMLYYYEGMTLTEVAQVMEVSSAALSKRLKKIRIKLKQYMEGVEEHE